MKKQHIYLLFTALVITLVSCSKDDEILEPAKSSAKQITSFVFKASENTAIAQNVSAVINETNKTISATVANGTDIKSLTPAIEVSNKAVVGQSGAKDFSSPIEYTITAEDGTSATYEVTVSIALNSAKQILSFAFKKEDNQLYGDETITATINEANKTITATVSYSANAALLTPSIEVSPNASVSPDTAQDFSNTVAYTVTAEDSTTTTYQILLEITFTDRDALIAIYNANPNNTLPWNLEDPDFMNWQGISVDENNNIIGLFLLVGRDGSDVVGYSLTTIPEEISKLSFLNTLDLGGNDITTIPSAIFKLENLARLYIDNNKLTSVSSDIKQLKKLTVLDLYANQLATLPKEIGELTSLTRLILLDNELTSIPAEIGQLKSLTFLDLYANQLTTLPKEIGGLISLTVLYLSQNQLTSITKEIGGLTSLTRLALNENELTSIPLELGNLTSLSGLYLSENKLTSIPKEIGKLKTLTRLYLTTNLLTSIPQEVCKLEDTGTIIQLDPGVKCE